ncbi:MAG: 30S ribosomal protein S9 [Candidatus Micrarchaeota archaeon]|nr:30S ribosomal protein S9 [Candidatus Micrarchaeota archaeon]MDE1859015.1 30S ribosomal protein S9 [Candidatus Micrarchaeota archaeon]
MANGKGIENLDKELETLYQPKAAQKAALKKAAPKAKKKAAATKKPILSKGKRKKSVARAALLPGSGRITLNGVDMALVKPKEVRELILESIRISKAAKDIASASDIKINVYGGGFSGQAQAARTALAKAIVEASGSDSLRLMYMSYDRSLLKDDYRRVEPKKFLGPKARGRFQKSYR